MGTPEPSRCVEVAPELPPDGRPAPRAVLGDSPPERALRWRRWWSDEEGRVTAFVVVLLIGLLALAGLVLDGGLALAAKVHATGQAESAARAGAQAIDLAAYRATGTVHLVPAQADTLAQRYLAGIGATGTVTVTGDTVTVTVTTIQHTQLLSLIGIRQIGAHGTGSAHPQHGVTVIEP